MCSLIFSMSTCIYFSQHILYLCAYLNHISASHTYPGQPSQQVNWDTPPRHTPCAIPLASRPELGNKYYLLRPFGIRYPRIKPRTCRRQTDILTTRQGHWEENNIDYNKGRKEALLLSQILSELKFIYLITQISKKGVGLYIGC